MSLALLVTGVFVLARMTGLMLSMPVLNFKAMPMTARILMALSITAVLTPVVPNAGVPTLLVILVGVAAEITLGILMGGIIGMVFGGLALGVEVISTQIGQGAALQFNPMLAISQGPIGGIAVLLATAVFLGFNFHHDMLRVLAISFVELPAGQFGSPLPGVEIWIQYSRVVIITGVRIAGPVLCLVFLVNSFMMVLTKIAPNMNVFFSVGFIFSMIGGMTLFFYMLPNLIESHMMTVSDAISSMPQLFERIRGGNGGK
jgi:flagellar biosynthesis protein FliR